jgi:hypothetical protein
LAFTATIDIPARFKNYKAVGGKGFIRKPPKRADYLLRYTRDNSPYRLQAPINRGIETPAQRYFQIGEPEA